MSATETRVETVADAIRLYIDGVAAGDTAKLEQAFHPDARMYGSIGGHRYDVPIGEMIKMAGARPADAGGSYQASIRSVDEEDDAAIAVVVEEGFWGALSFVDYFSLARIEGSWRIVNKTFAHTGGSMPAQ